MRSFRSPEWNELVEIGPIMEVSYQLACNNSSFFKNILPRKQNRSAYNTLYQRFAQILAKDNSLTTEQKKEKLLGLGAMILAQIKLVEYKGASPKKKENSSFGSDYYTQFKANLKITKDNPFSYQERFIFLSELYDYITKVGNDSMFSDTVWGNKKNFLDSIEAVSKKILYKDPARMEFYIERTPLPHVLRQNIKNAADKYDKTREQRWIFGRNNAERISMEHFVLLINDTCDILYPETPQALTNSRANNIRLGGLLLALLDIYKNTTLSSALFDHFLEAMNGKDIDKTKIDKIKVLRALATHLDEIKTDKNCCASIQNAQQNGMKNLDEYKAKINAHLLELEQIAQTPPRSQRYISHFAAFIAKYAFGIGVTQISKDFIGMLFAYLPKLFVATTGPLGWVASGVTTTILLKQISRMVSEYVGPTALTYVYALMVGSASENFGHAVGGVLTKPFVDQKKSDFQDFMDEVLTPDQQKTFERFLRTLLTRPKQVFSEEHKERIERVYGIKREAPKEEALPTVRVCRPK